MGQLAADVQYLCTGKDSCKGALTTTNCGTGFCEMEFTGESAGMDAKVYTNQALGFNCVGRYVFCPDNIARHVRALRGTVQRLSFLVWSIVNVNVPTIRMAPIAPMHCRYLIKRPVNVS